MEDLKELVDAGASVLRQGNNKEAAVPHGRLNALIDNPVEKAEMTRSGCVSSRCSYPNARFSHPPGLELSPFLHAVAEGNLDLSLKFISLGADVQDQDQTLGLTALQLAAASGCVALVEHLISLGAIVSGKHFHVPQGEEGDKISRFLHSRGSTPCVRVPQGMVAVEDAHMFAEMGITPCAELSTSMSELPLRDGSVLNVQESGTVEPETLPTDISDTATYVRTCAWV